MHSPKQWCFIKCIEHSKTIQNCGVFYRWFQLGERQTSPKISVPLCCQSGTEYCFIHSAIFVEYAESRRCVLIMHT